MAKAYLILNAVLYAVFAIWCTIAPTKTATFLGLGLPSASGKSEYITVYGGLEFGVAAFFLLTALRPGLQPAGVLFAVCFYSGLIAWRLGTFLVIQGIGRTTFAFAASELVLGVMAWAILLRKG
jgi:hypothetical protein